MSTTAKWSKRGLRLECDLSTRPSIHRQFATVNVSTDPGYVGGLPTGGATGESIRKSSDADFEFEFFDPANVDHASNHAPNGGDPLPWATAHGRGTTSAKPAPSAANVGYLYFDTDLNVLQRSNGTAWEDCVQGGLPPGGDDGQVLAKASAADFDLEWIDPPEGGGGGGGADANGVLHVPFGTPPTTPVSGECLLFVDYLAAGEEAVPVMTSDSTPSGWIASTSSSHPSFAAYQAYQQKIGTGAGMVSYNSGCPWWTKIRRVAGAFEVGTYSITPWSSDTWPGRTWTAWTLQGSNDDSSWTTLDTQSVSTSFWQSNTPARFTLASLANYAYYRVYVTATGGDNYVGCKCFSLESPSTTLQLKVMDNSGNIRTIGTVT